MHRAVLPSAKYRPKITSPMNAPTCRCCVATYWKDQTWRSHRQIASSLIFITKLQISPLILNGFKNGFHQWIQRIFLVVVDAKICFPKIFFFKIWIHFTALLRVNRWCWRFCVWRWALLWHLP